MLCTMLVEARVQMIHFCLNLYLSQVWLIRHSGWKAQANVVCKRKQAGDDAEG